MQVSHALSDFYSRHNRQVQASVSFGVAEREEADCMETLLHLADRRMYANTILPSLTTDTWL